MLQRIPNEFISQLDIPSAVASETTSWRNLLPPEPWLDAVTRDSAGVASWVTARLEAGAHNAAVTTISARKGLQGTRPVPILGVGERIAYRALADFVLQDLPAPARSPEDYAKFTKGPITHAYRRRSGIHKIKDARFSHVIEADITAFYQYVDHELLRREVEMQTGRIDACGYLIELLEDVQGASYGLPQLLGPSDALSEVYIRIMERDIVRRGLRTWRYNDDFRIGVTSYDAAQDALEQVSEAARSLGLVLNEQKTYISRFFTYLVRHLSPDIPHDTTQFDPEDLQVASDYTLSEEETIEEAESTLARLDLNPGEEEHRIDLKALTGDDLGALRGAVNSLGRLQSPAALRRIVHLFLFAPALTPRLIEYLLSMPTSAQDEVERVWDTLTAEFASNLIEWQAVWLIHAAQQLGILDANDGRVAYVRSQRLRRSGGLLHAQASLALAEIGEIAFSDLDIALRMEPEPLAPWYVLGIKALAANGSVDPQQVQAVKDSSPLYRLLIES